MSFYAVRTGWDTRSAIRQLAENAARNNTPNCPACGAPGTVDLIDITAFGGPEFIPGAEWRCTAECWRTDPQRYLDAVNGQTHEQRLVPPQPGPAGPNPYIRRPPIETERAPRRRWLNKENRDPS